MDIVGHAPGSKCGYVAAPLEPTELSRIRTADSADGSTQPPARAKQTHSYIHTTLSIAALVITHLCCRAESLHVCVAYPKRGRPLLAPALLSSLPMSVQMRDVFVQVYGTQVRLASKNRAALSDAPRRGTLAFSRSGTSSGPHKSRHLLWNGCFEHRMRPFVQLNI